MLEIIEFPLPETADDPNWQAYRRLCHAHNEELIAGPEWNVSPADSLVSAKDNTTYTMRRFLARLAGEVVGWASSRVNHVDDPEAVAVSVYVAAEHRNNGIGRALAERLRAETAGFKRHIAWVMGPIPGEFDTVTTASNGIGQFCADHPGLRLALSYGLRIGQIERVSRYDLQTPSVDPAEVLAEARRHATGYELIVWEGAAGEELLADLATLKQRMTTDVPAGDLTIVEAVWDAARMRRFDEQLLLTSRLFRAAARHQESGAVVALNELVVPRSNEHGFVDQWDTIVAPEHRGHRLGLLVKAANIIALREAIPQSPAIVTWNAEENRHMLAVNESLGFYPILVEAALETTAG